METRMSSASSLRGGRVAPINFNRRTVALRAQRCRLQCNAVASPPSRPVDAPQAPVPAVPTMPEAQRFNIVADETKKPVGKQRVVILGSGWGAASFMKQLSKSCVDKYEFIVVSPRNYFLYTPLLPAVATGTMEERSIVEPVRRLVLGKGQYYEAVAQEINVQQKSIVACFPKDAGFPEACFKVSYDYLVLAVGCINNTFGISGVQEHCFFFKTVEDANKLRMRISECFERAALPQTDAEERKRLLSFVVAGGGPTGVEVAAELYDMMKEDYYKLYPDLMKDVSIKLVELTDHVLSTYDRKISEYTHQLFQRNGIDLVLNTKVTGVEDGSLKVVDKEKKEYSIPFGACVWATGVAMHPLIKSLQSQMPGQTHFRSIVTDDFLRVKHSDGSIFAIGDAATIEQKKALEYVNDLFERADVNKDGVLQLSELRAVLKIAAAEFPHLQEHAQFLEGMYGQNRFGGLVKKAFHKAESVPAKDLAEVKEDSTLSRDEFAELLTKIDKGLRALPATAQVARQQGEYLADLFNAKAVEPGKPLPDTTPKFKYSHKGSLAYVGSDRAVMDVPRAGPLYGLGVGLLWKGFETYSQFSFRNKCLVAVDWVRTKLFGRDISRV